MEAENRIDLISDFISPRSSCLGPQSFWMGGLQALPRSTKLSRTFMDYHVPSLLNSSLEIQKAQLEKKRIIHFLALILLRNRGPFILPFSLSFYT